VEIRGEFLRPYVEGRPWTKLRDALGRLVGGRSLKIRSRAGQRRLLHDVHELVGEQTVTLTGLRGERSVREHDVLTGRVGESVQSARRRFGASVVWTRTRLKS
jgi:hypothetical protein